VAAGFTPCDHGDAVVRNDDNALDDLIAFILATAARDDDWHRRSLGMIHLLKYAYLADMYVAEAGHPVFTGASWRFHHFGPWDAALFERIERTVNRMPGAQPVDIPNRFGDDRRHWMLAVDEEEYDEIRRRVPSSVRVRLPQDIRNCANVTEAVLDRVYKTQPMLIAAPGQLLQFEARVVGEAPPPAYGADDERQMAVKRKKKLQKAKEGLRGLLDAWRAERASLEKGEAVHPAPRYDEVFVEGTAWLDSLAAGESGPLTEGRGTLVIDDSVWHSPGRGGGGGG
jgi:hypothetical protein